MIKLMGIIGIIVVLAIAFYVKEKKTLTEKHRIALLAQLVLAFIMIKTSVWKAIEVLARSNLGNKQVNYGNKFCLWRLNR